jgi:beta-N-acetylhexosaminidase
MKVAKQILVAVLVATFFNFPLVFAQSSPYQPLNRELTRDEEKWVRDTLKRLPLDARIGQMFLADGNAIFMNRQTEAYQQLKHQIEDNKVGGVLWFRSDVWATAVLTNRLQTMADVPLLIASDLEMGLGMRLNDTQWWPPNMAVAATGNVTYALNQGICTAREARAIGINWLFAPVADVNNNPDNPVINVRSYSEDPQTVANFALAFVQGAQGENVLACAKHFPGHGNTATDSHIGLPVVDVNLDSLRKQELLPFRVLAGTDKKKEPFAVSAVMSAHISLPQVEPDAVAPVRKLNANEQAAAEFTSQTEANAAKVTKPATLSQKILTGILRDELKFGGLVVTDAMNMAGIAARYDAATAALEAIKAGVDVIEKCPDIDAAIKGVKEAVARKEISEERINASVTRILRAKAALGLNAERFVDLDKVDQLVSSPGCQMVAQDIADHSITLVRDEKKLLPLKANTRLLNLTFADDDGVFNSQTFVTELRNRKANVETVTLDYRATEADLQKLFARLEQTKFDAVIFASLVRARSGKGTVSLPPIGLRLAEELTKRDLPLLVVSFGNPYLLTALPNAKAYVAAYSPYPFSQRAAARALLGEIEITGKLPVSLPGLYPRGHGLEIKKR